MVNGINQTKDGDPSESATGQMPKSAYLVCIQDLTQEPPTLHGQFIHLDFKAGSTLD